MKALFSSIAFFSLLFSSSIAMANDEWFIKIENIMHYELDAFQAKDVLQEWVGIHEENRKTYLYYLTTETYFCELESSIKTAEITGLDYSCEEVNVLMNINRDADLHFTFNRKTGKVIHCRAINR
ncbi:hypothetical protein [Flammeovirga sp. EKP202]|uniref:hypothetical protein n=1 Tax=Flammeovirga sp. EKP202 TaxID=2770592 RepID=UPI00165FAE06|nr:hypothetical protein [Flammeovirga sp. EKP202]MBD0402335.1 hypothetical protein [Flammeovirga sp. EKP202]